MSSLGSKSTQEISDLLDEYGVKHGPVVGSTRSLYEKKLKEAMAKGKRAGYKSSPDKTYYREEEEEVTYVYRTPVRSEDAGGYGDGRPSMSSRPGWPGREYEQEASYSAYSRTKPEYRERTFVDEPHIYDKPSSYSSSYLKSTPMKSGQDAPKTTQSSRLIPLWVQFVFFLAVAVFLYLVFSNMESNEPLKGIQ